MCPLRRACRPKIVGIRLNFAARRLRLFEPICQAVALCIGDRSIFGFEAQANLAQHVARPGPSHERLDTSRHLRIIFEDPAFRTSCARLCRGLGRPIYSCSHLTPLFQYCVSVQRSETGSRALATISWHIAARWSGQQDLNLRPEVPKTSALPGCAIPRTSNRATLTAKIATMWPSHGQAADNRIYSAKIG
jgi:hypothetical protein